MRTLVSLAAVALLMLVPSVAFAGYGEEMTSQMHEWVNYERPPFEPVEVQVDGVELTLFDATIESHPLEDATTIVRVIMRARRGERPAAVTRAALIDRDGTSYPAAYAKAPPVEGLEEQGFKVYAFRLREVDHEALRSLEVTVNGTGGGAEPTTTQVSLAVGEHVRFSDLDFASISAVSAFLMFFYYALTTSSGF